VGGAESDAKLFVAHDHRAVEREIGDAGVRLFGEKDRGGEIGRCVPLPVGDLRQLRDLSVTQVVRRRYWPKEIARARLHSALELEPAAREVAVAGADHLAQPLPAPVEIARDRKARALDAPEQDRLVALGLGELDHRRELVMRIDLALHHAHLAAPEQLAHVIPHTLLHATRTIRYFCATRSISTSASRARAVTPTQVRAGSRPDGK